MTNLENDLTAVAVPTGNRTHLADRSSRLKGLTLCGVKPSATLRLRDDHDPIDHATCRKCRKAVGATVPQPVVRATWKAGR